MKAFLFVEKITNTFLQPMQDLYTEDRNFVDTKTNGTANIASALGAVTPQDVRLSSGRAGL